MKAVTHTAKPHNIDIDTAMLQNSLYI